MALTINSNAASLRTTYALDRASDALKTSYERLSSGMRINRAKDDIAGFSISTRMEVKVREQNKAIQNLGDAVAMTQIADVGLREGTQVLQRMLELAVQSANDTYGATDRQSLEDELTQLKQQLEHLGNSTEYNGQKLLDGSMSGRKIEIGGPGSSGGTLEWLSVDSNTAQLSAQEGVFSAWWSVAGGEPQLPSILTQSQAEEAVATISNAMQTVATQRTRIGAFENRLQSIQNNLMHSVTDVSAARSKIQEADFAQESANLTSRSIIQNATAAVLVQANQQPGLVKQLLP
ncbi:MAG: flagellin FliC [Magnetococcus sp. XQGC-1]